MSAYHMHDPILAETRTNYGHQTSDLRRGLEHYVEPYIEDDLSETSSSWAGEHLHVDSEEDDLSETSSNWAGEHLHMDSEEDDPEFESIGRLDVPLHNEIEISTIDAQRTTNRASTHETHHTTRTNTVTYRQTFKNVTSRRAGTPIEDSHHEPTTRYVNYNRLVDADANHMVIVRLHSTHSTTKPTTPLPNGSTIFTVQRATWTCYSQTDG